MVTNGLAAGQLIVVNRGAGFVLDADDPAHGWELDTAPIVGLVVDRAVGVILVADFTNVTGYGLDGELWTSEVSWDGVELHGVEDGVLHGRGRDLPSGQWLPLDVDVATGTVLTGPRRRT
jgi:hypothetical protein